VLTVANICKVIVDCEMWKTSTCNLTTFWAYRPAGTKIYFLVILLSFQKLHKKVKYWLVLTVANICKVIVDWKMGKTSTRNLTPFWAFFPARTKIYFLMILLSFQEFHKKVQYWLVVTVANICKVALDWKMSETSTRNLMTFWAFCPACTKIYFFVIL